ncbi:hypothetical protein OG590_34150 [Streptomyces goshikiensis]|uniref:hypothetical protein n=1 Tax=Streptomyces goshikiensis TaxID=1942 RepID=UPI003409DCE6|nr:hypothetical protein OG590_34150 [Streptomyces goshikiensis]
MQTLMRAHAVAEIDLCADQVRTAPQRPGFYARPAPAAPRCTLHAAHRRLVLGTAIHPGALRANRLTGPASPAALNTTGIAGRQSPPGRPSHVAPGGLSAPLARNAIWGRSHLGLATASALAYARIPRREGSGGAIAQDGTRLPAWACLALALTACGTAEPTVGAGSASPSAKASPSASAEPLAGKTPAEIRWAGYHETESTTLKKLRGQATTNGRTTSFDLAFDNDGDCAGNLTTDGAGTTHLHANAYFVYAKRDAAEWRPYFAGLPKGQVAELTNRYADHWIKLDSKDRTAQALAVFCRLKDPLLLTGTEENSRIEKGPTATVEGQPTLTLTYQITAGGSAKTVTDYISSRGLPYLLKRSETGPEVQADYTYTDLNTMNRLLPPPDAEVIAFDAGK